MIKFSLSRILEESPYNLILSGTDFRFITDFGIHYSVSFNKEDIVLGECETYQLIIRKIDEIRSKHDPKVEKTILAIIDEFFRSNLEILLYMCDTSDGRESIRNRLFISWFEKYANKERFKIQGAGVMALTAICAAGATNSIYRRAKSDIWFAIPLALCACGMD